MNGNVSDLEAPSSSAVNETSASLWPVGHLPVRALRPPTGGIWFNVRETERWLSQLPEPTGGILLLDLNSVQPTLAVLEQLLPALGEAVKRGTKGQVTLIVSTRDLAIRHYVEMLSTERRLPIFLSDSTTSYSLMGATPAIMLTATDTQTLHCLMDLGGRATAREVALALGLTHTAAINRLNDVAEKKLAFRLEQPGNRAIVFCDARLPSVDYSSMMMAAMSADLT